MRTYVWPTDTHLEVWSVNLQVSDLYFCIFWWWQWLLSLIHILVFQMCLTHTLHSSRGALCQTAAICWFTESQCKWWSQLLAFIVSTQSNIVEASVSTCHALQFSFVSISIFKCTSACLYLYSGKCGPILSWLLLFSPKPVLPARHM